MKVTQKEKEDVLVVLIEGEINIDTIDILKKELKSVLAKGARKVILNFNRVEYIDSLGIATLIEFSKSLESIQGELFLSNLSPKLRPLFGITKLEKIFKIYESEEEALRDFHGR